MATLPEMFLTRSLKSAIKTAMDKLDEDVARAAEDQVLHHVHENVGSLH